MYLNGSLRLLLAVCYALLVPQPCLLAGDPFSAPLLQSACRGMTQLYTVTTLGTLLGSAVAADAMARNLSSTACQDAVSAARTLAWFRTAASDMVLTAGFLLLEWRLKAAFVQKHSGRQLVYGPFRWGQGRVRSQPANRITAYGPVRVSSLQAVLTWLLVVPCVLALLWGLALVLVPRLPHAECSSIEGYSSSNVTLSHYCGECVQMHSSVPYTAEGVAVCFKHSSLPL